MNERSAFRSQLKKALDAFGTKKISTAWADLGPLDPQISIDEKYAVPSYLGGQLPGISQAAHQSSYYEKSEHLADTDTDNVIELKSCEFKIANPGFGACIKRVSAQIAHQMGVTERFKITLKRMFIYQSGPVVIPDSEIEKPGRFARLFVSLPSGCTGGQVEIRDQDRQKVQFTDDDGLLVKGWYSYSVQGIRPIISGHRRVLMYKLWIDAPQSPPGASLETQQAKALSECLRTWLDQSKRPLHHAYYRLHHQYTKADLSLYGPRNSDRVIVDVLKALSEVLTVEIFVSTLIQDDKRHDGWTGGYGKRSAYIDSGLVGAGQSQSNFEAPHPLDEFPLTVLTMVDIHGSEIIQAGFAKEDNVLQEVCLAGTDMEKSYDAHSGYPVNSSLYPSTHQRPWKNTVSYAPGCNQFAAVVIVPRDSLGEFFEICWGGSSYIPGYKPQRIRNMTNALRYVERSLARAPRNPGSVKSLKLMCQRVLQPINKHPYQVESRKTVQLTEVDLTNLTKTAFLSEDRELITMARDLHTGNLSLEFFTWAKTKIDAGVMNIRFAKKDLLEAIVRYPILWKQQRALEYLFPPTRDAKTKWPDEILPFIITVHESVLGIMSVQRLGFKDGKAVVDMLGYHDDKFFAARKTYNIVPAVVAQTSQMSFIYGFLNRVGSRRRQAVSHRASLSDIGMKVAKVFVETIDVTRIAGLCKISAASVQDPRQYFSINFSSQDSRQGLPDHACTNLAHVLVKLARRDETKSLVSTFFERICDQVPSFSEDEFHWGWLPFLITLTRILQAKQGSLSDLGATKVSATIIKFYIDNYIGEPPTMAGNLKLPTVRCPSDCNDCSALNAFLQDPTRQVGRFPLNKERRQHLHSKLDIARIDCSHVTERSGIPQTLVVTKGAHKDADAQVAWSQRRSVARSWLREFRLQDMDSWLGKEFEPLMIKAGLLAPSRRTSGKIEDRLPPLPGLVRGLQNRDMGSRVTNPLGLSAEAARAEATRLIGFLNYPHQPARGAPPSSHTRTWTTEPPRPGASAQPWTATGSLVNNLRELPAPPVPAPTASASTLRTAGVKRKADAIEVVDLT
ncbi:hypothetical protein N7539_007833 [Penicillium diatomitis]|uniref:Uncharacterized protein n=1 Tax=Penicillium diatomitis TaxID=2819901 RepID=A0A9W9WUG5_9EURO|nr:uncharacterized protein N7539_007833 [Penicillium diatomitis]KAJ5475546.1 hypothetical protein N7539_007833 [Penicillium diatomitis]